MSKEAQPKYPYLPEATNDHFMAMLSDNARSGALNERNESDESAQDPWIRPDTIDDNSPDDSPYDREGNSGNESIDESAAVEAFDPLILSSMSSELSDQPTEPCPCCGAELPSPLWPGDICPRCWWENDPFLSTPTEPSDQNHGLSLEEARWNFHTFGVSDPQFLDKLVSDD